MKERLLICIAALLSPFAAAFAEQVAVEISTDQPAALTILNGEEKRIRLPAVLFLEKDRAHQFAIKGEKGFSFDSKEMIFSRSEKLDIRLGYEPYVTGKEFCYWALLLPGICGISTGEHAVGGSLVLSSVVGLYVTAFYLRALAITAKADYNGLPAGTNQSNFDAQIKKASGLNTGFAVTLGLAVLWHLFAIGIDGGLWGMPIYSQDPRTLIPKVTAFKIQTIQYPGEVVNYAYTAKNF